MSLRRTEPLETKAETDYCRDVERVGALTRKLNGLGYRDWPDRWVIAPWGEAWVIEFKRKDEKPRRSQELLHEALRTRGVQVLVFDTYDDAVAHFCERWELHTTIDRFEEVMGVVRRVFGVEFIAAFAARLEKVTVHVKQGKTRKAQRR